MSNTDSPYTDELSPLPSMNTPTGESPEFELPNYPSQLTIRDTDQKSPTDATRTIQEKSSSDAMHTAGLSEIAQEQKETIPLNEVVYFQVEDEPNILLITEANLNELGIKKGGGGATLEESIAEMEKAAKIGVPITLLILDQKFPQKKKEGSPARNFVTALAEIQKKPDFEEALKNLRTIVFFTGTGDRAEVEKFQDILPNYTIVLLQKPVGGRKMTAESIKALIKSNIISADKVDSILEELQKEL